MRVLLRGTEAELRDKYKLIIVNEESRWVEFVEAEDPRPINIEEWRFTPMASIPHEVMNLHRDLDDYEEPNRSNDIILPKTKTHFRFKVHDDAQLRTFEVSFSQDLSLVIAIFYLIPKKTESAPVSSSGFLPAQGYQPPSSQFNFHDMY